MSRPTSCLLPTSAEISALCADTRTFNRRYQNEDRFAVESMPPKSFHDAPIEHACRTMRPSFLLHLQFAPTL